MSREADVWRSGERNLVRRAILDDLDAVRTIGIDEDLSLHEEVAYGAVIMGTDVRYDGTVRNASGVGEGCGSVVEPGELVQARTEGCHRPIEDDQRGHQDLSSDWSHPGQ